MKILVQKVLNASVTVNKQLVSQINQGFLLFIGVEKGDTFHADMKVALINDGPCTFILEK